MPLQPTMTGANFQKWSTDQAGADTFNFSTPVTASGTLYAQYTCISANHFIKDENGVCVCDAANYYVDDGNGQGVLSTRTITYHPNG